MVDMFTVAAGVMMAVVVMTVGAVLVLMAVVTVLVVYIVRRPRIGVVEQRLRLVDQMVALFALRQ